MASTLEHTSGTYEEYYEHCDYSYASSTTSGGLSPADSWTSHANIQLDIAKEVLEVVPLDLLDKKNEDIDDMTDREIEKLRTTVVIKTFSSLLKQHQFRTAEDLENQIKDVRRFGQALFNNVRGGNVSRHVLL
eukprot:scaffold123241_cov40-Prasinocladus_malaysianus.AAC.1